MREVTSLYQMNPYPIYCRHINESICPPPGEKFLPRRVKWYEIELIQWSEGGYMITDGKKYMAEKGRLFLKRPGMLTQGTAPYHCYFILFDPVFKEHKSNLYNQNGHPYVDQLYADLDNINTYDEFDAPRILFLENFPEVIDVSDQYSQFESLFSECCSLFIQQKEDCRFYIKANILKLLNLCYQKLSSDFHINTHQRSNLLNKPKIITVKKYVDKNITKTFTLNELAVIADMSPSFLSRMFHSLTGESLFAYINRSKVSLAKMLLIDTNRSIKEISFECGYDNITYFHTLFKKLEGISPAEYRVLHKVI